VDIGKLKVESSSPILKAIQDAEAGTTGEIRVHLSQRPYERDPYQRALKIFEDYEMFRTQNRNAILIYVNLRKHQFAFVGDRGLHSVIDASTWRTLALELSDNLRSTHSERAIALTIESLGKILMKFFPQELS
jgi:uncharacterized membrane protein